MQTLRPMNSERGLIMSADLLATARCCMLNAGLGGTLAFTAISAGLYAVVTRVRHILASMRTEFIDAREEGRRKLEQGR